VKTHLIAHHRAMERAYRDHADSMDDGAEHKSLFSKLAEHHGSLVKALEPSSLGDLPDVEEETRTQNAGYGIYPADKTLRTEDLEKLFGGI
jgi:hypothetical protein